jgi:hydrogenase maturation protease
MPKQRVVCVGNDICHDDGVARMVGQTLEDDPRLPKGVEIVHIAEFGLSALDAFLSAEQVVLVDAVTTGNRPGTCSVVSRLDFVPEATCSIGHAITLGSMLELVAHLQPAGCVPEVSVVGIEAENLAPFGTTLSPAVLEAVPKAVELVLSILGRHCA